MAKRTPPNECVTVVRERRLALVAEWICANLLSWFFMLVRIQSRVPGKVAQFGSSTWLKPKVSVVQVHLLSPMEDKLRCVKRLLESIERDGIEMDDEVLDGYAWLVCGCTASHAKEYAPVARKDEAPIF